MAKFWEPECPDAVDRKNFRGRDEGNDILIGGHRGYGGAGDDLGAGRFDSDAIDTSTRQDHLVGSVGDDWLVGASGSDAGVRGYDDEPVRGRNIDVFLEDGVGRDTLVGGCNGDAAAYSKVDRGAVDTFAGVAANSIRFDVKDRDHGNSFAFAVR